MWGGFGGFGGWNRPRGMRPRGGGYGSPHGRNQNYGGWGGHNMRPQNQQGWGGPQGGYGTFQGVTPQGQGQRPSSPALGIGTYAGAVKNQNTGGIGKMAESTPMAKSGPPQRKKLKLEQMGFGNMGSGFGCSMFVPNQGEEMPTMLQMGYAGDEPLNGSGFGDGGYGTDGVKQEIKQENGGYAGGAVKMEPGKGVGPAGGKSGGKSDWPPSLMDYIARAFGACRNDKEKDQTEGYLKNLLNGRLKSGSAYDIDWETEPLPKIYLLLIILKMDKNKRKEIQLGIVCLIQNMMNEMIEILLL